MYTLSEVTDKIVRVEELPDTEFTHDQVKMWLRLSFAQTYASIQGTEFDTHLRLHDTGHTYFTKRHLFVGLSRAKMAAHVSVVD